MQSTIRINAPEDFGPRDLQAKQVLAIRQGSSDRPQPRFHLVHYPTDWDWVDGFGFLPGLTKANEVAAVNGVAPRDVTRAVSDANPLIASGMLNGVTAKGGIVIPYNDPRVVRYFGRRNGYYAVGYETTAGKWYTMPWERPTQAAGGPIHWNVKESQQADLEFRRFLRDEGIVPMPEIEAIEALVRNWQHAVEARMSNHPEWEKNPQLARRINRDRAKVEAVNEWLSEKVTGSPDLSEDEIPEPEPAPQAPISVGGRKKREVPNG